MLEAVVITFGAVVFAWLIFASLFRHLKPEILIDDYKPCCGDWYEGHLNNCSQGLVKIPQQPVNTYSNLAFLASGLFLAAWLGTGESYVFAATMIYLCIGSTLYHATSTRWGGMLDVTAIYTAFSALATFAICRFIGIPSWLTVALMFTIGGLASYLLSHRYKRKMHLKIGIFLGLAYLFLVLQMWMHSNWLGWQYALVALALFAIAFLLWNLDLRKPSPLGRWGHGLWHVLDGVAGGMLFYAIHISR